MATQDGTYFHSTIEFLSKDCKDKNHVDCCKVWAGIGIQVICNCSCHHNDSNDSYTIHIRRHLDE